MEIKKKIKKPQQNGFLMPLYPLTNLQIQLEII